MARSLALFAPERLARSEGAGFDAAWLKAKANPGLYAGSFFQPLNEDDPAGIAFNGAIDNRAELLRELGIARDAQGAEIYAAAYSRWGEDADLHLHGEYCSIIVFATRPALRLARSPIIAPPLHYHAGAEQGIAASVPRALIARGISDELDRDYLAAHLALMPPSGEGGFYRHIRRVPLGCAVHLEPGSARLAPYYDLRDLPFIAGLSDSEVEECTRDLIAQAVRRIPAPFDAPAMALSGGLDSPIIAAALLRERDGPLHCHTHHPEEGAPVALAANQFADEREKVRAFAAQHGRVQLHFTDSAGAGFDHFEAQMHLAIGASPSGLPLQIMQHELLRAARANGADAMLYAGLGNQTFSNNGARGLVEYLRTGRWRQLRAALAARPFDPRPLWRRALSLSVLRALPRPLYDCIMALRHRRVIPQFSTRAGALDPHWAGADAIARAFAAEDPHYNSAFAASAMDERTFWQAGGDFDGGDVRQGLEQVHGIALRDICGYRPLVEFCLGLPTDQFLRDGQDRWLARRLAQGDVPPQIAQEKRYGFHLADYHARLVRDQARWLEQVERMEDDPDIAGLIDLPRARALLQNLPDRPSADPEEYEPVMLALPRIMAAARFVRWHKGSNN